MVSQDKTTYSFRLTEEQKAKLQDYQKQFKNQADFVALILELLNEKFNGTQTEPFVEDENILRVHLTPEREAFLEYVANRESTETVKVEKEHILMYVFDEMLVKGNKFSIDSIPDSVIRKIRKELSND